MYQYTSVQRVFSKLTREGVSFSEEDIVEQIGEALGFIGTVRMLEEAVAFAEVKNHQCFVPQYAQVINQIAQHNNWTVKVNNPYCPKTVIEEANIFYQDCATCGGTPQGVDMGYVVLDGKGTPLVEYDIAYYRPYFDLLGEYYGWSNCAHYRNNYTPVRLANSSFFNTVVDKHYDGSLYDNCKDEYTIIGGNVLRFSFSTGFVAISYKRAVLDPVTGWPMIPDNMPHITAITSYIKFMQADKEFMNNREGSGQKRQVYENDWQWYCGQASNEDKMPQGIDGLQNLLDQRSHMLPNDNHYYNFFGNLNNPEYRKWNDPDFRNNKYTLISNG